MKHCPFHIAIQLDLNTTGPQANPPNVSPQKTQKGLSNETSARTSPPTIKKIKMDPISAADYYAKKITVLKRKK